MSNWELNVSDAGAPRTFHRPSDVELRELFWGRIVKNWQIVVPGFGDFIFPCTVTALSYEGLDRATKISFEITLPDKTKIKSVLPP